MIDKNKLITELDKLDCISNINYYTNNCNSHDDIVNTIQDYIERLEQALINKIEWKSAKQVLPQEWDCDTHTISDDVLCY